MGPWFQVLQFVAIQTACNWMTDTQVPVIHARFTRRVVNGLAYLQRKRRLKGCKIRGFHGSDYEQCSLLGYKNQLRTSQETCYLSATESSQLMLCKI
jgi:hypothetical protein